MDDHYVWRNWGCTRATLRSSLACVLGHCISHQLIGTICTPEIKTQVSNNPARSLSTYCSLGDKVIYLLKIPTAAFTLLSLKFKCLFYWGPPNGYTHKYTLNRELSLFCSLYILYHPSSSCITKAQWLLHKQKFIHQNMQKSSESSPALFKMIVLTCFTMSHHYPQLIFCCSQQVVRLCIPQRDLAPQAELREFFSTRITHLFYI